MNVTPGPLMRVGFFYGVHLTLNTDKTFSFDSGLPAALADMTYATELEGIEHLAEWFSNQDYIYQKARMLDLRADVRAKVRALVSA